MTVVFREPENLLRCGGWPPFGCLVDASASPHVCRGSIPSLCNCDPVSASWAAVMTVPSGLGKSLCPLEVCTNPVLHRLCTEVVGEHLIHSFLQIKQSWPKLSSFTYEIEEFSLEQGCLPCFVCKILLLPSNSRTAALCVLEQAQAAEQTPWRASEGAACRFCLLQHNISFPVLGCCVDFALWKRPLWESISGSALSRFEQTCGQRLRALERGWLTLTCLPLSKLL